MPERSLNSCASETLVPTPSVHATKTGLSISLSSSYMPAKPPILFKTFLL